MISFQRILRGDRSCKAITGMTIKELAELNVQFEWNLKEYRLRLKKDRKRAIGAGQKGFLPASIDKLVFILVYLKCYPTFDLMSVLFNLDRGKCCRWVHLLLPALEQTLGRTMDLPKRKINAIDEFMKYFPEVKDIFIDGTERRIQRPKNIKTRNKLYSGKKKTTTRKNIVTTDEFKKILILSKSKSGRRNDKKLADKDHLASNIPKAVTIWTDTGFMGFKHPNVIMPKKKTKNRPLTLKEKASNKLIAGIRVVNEHAIAGIKRFAVSTNIYRNKKANFDDQLILLASGLWNFHLKFAN